MAKLALLIEVSQYQPGLTPLPAAENDVLAIQRILQHPEIGNFSDIQILHNPDPLEMQEAIETLFSGRAKDDLVLLFFSGHGVKDDAGRLYFATRLTRKDERGALRKSTAVAASFIHDIMSNSRSKRQVVILDCCFSGAFAEGLLAKDDGAVDIKTQLGGEGRVILTSSTSTQYSFEQQGSELSIYTRYLVEGIETGMADRDGDGVISVDELHEYAKNKVQAAAPAMKPEIYAVKEGYTIILAQAPVGDAKLRYRKEVEAYASQGEISFIGRKVLDAFGESLGLHPEEISAIETEVLQPYREYKKKLQQYEQVLVEVVQQEPILSENTRSELKKLQQILGLGDEDIAPIAARIIPQQEQTKPVAEEQTVNPQSPAKSEDVSSPQQQYSNTFNISDSNITALSGSGQINYYEAPKKPGN
ncbi:caspase family protein [Calothrix sp. FACHB-156]|nr:caspase family protein [Calothrix sp. FACHB-156]